LEEKIRQNLPGFEQFQSPPDVKQLMDLAEFGPSDGIQCHLFRIDAFIVTHHDIRAIPLPELKWDELKASMRMFYGDNEDLYKGDAEPWRILQCYGTPLSVLFCKILDTYHQAQ
jgi:hypothetical protein